MASENMTSEKKSVPPIDNVNIRGVRVAVWEHEKEQRKYRQLTIKKNYKDESGEFRSIESFNVSDIPNIVLALQEVYKKEVTNEYLK